MSEVKMTPELAQEVLAVHNARKCACVDGGECYGNEAKGFLAGLSEGEARGLEHERERAKGLETFVDEWSEKRCPYVDAQNKVCGDCLRCAAHLVRRCYTQEAKRKDGEA